MDINDFEVYRLSIDFGEIVYKLVRSFHYFDERTIGIQFVESSDSIAANISEGFGRFYYKDKMRFYFFARGSLLESQTWLEKSYKRKLIDETTFMDLSVQIKRIGVKLNNTITQLRNKS